MFECELVSLNVNSVLECDKYCFPTFSHLHHYQVVETYEWTGRHTYFPMGISAAISLILLVLLVILYKRLAPHNQRATEKIINATNEMTSSNNSNEASGETVAIYKYHILFFTISLYAVHEETSEI